jgi:TM2 domain-containing membrane protein YozV
MQNPEITMAQIAHYLPELNEPEAPFIASLTAAMSHDDIQRFAAGYRQARRDPQTLRVMAIIGLVAVPGLQRFLVGQVGIGILFLLTGGLLWIGTIIDIVKYQELALVYNRKVARRIANNVIQSSSSPGRVAFARM